MNSAALRTLKQFQQLLPFQKGDVLDVGSLNINCRWSGKDLWQPPHCQTGPWNYYGVDLKAGPNVDQVVEGDTFDLGRTFDVVVSIGVIEHCQRPWDLLDTMACHLNPNGWLYALVPWVCPYHAYPRDAWRISQDGWAVLCEDCGLELVQSFIYPDRLCRELTLVGLALNLWMRLRYGCRPKESVLFARKA